MSSTLIVVLEEGLGHKYFSAEKSRDPASARLPPAFESKKYTSHILIIIVLEEGLEPSSLAALVPKTSAYTNSATPDFALYVFCGHKYFSTEKSRDPASASSCLRLAQSIICFVRPGGIEPPTLSLRGICSTS